MPWYLGNIPAKWESALSRKVGARFSVEVILDPEGDAILLDGDRDISNISELTQKKELDVDEGSSIYIQDITLSFNDKSSYFDPDNPSSPFHSCNTMLSESADAGASTLKLMPFSGVEFIAGEELEISDSTNSERITVKSFEEDSGSTGYHSLSLASPGLAHAYSAGVNIYTVPVIGKDILIKLINSTETTDEELTLFLGKIERAPEISPGVARIICSDSRKLQLDTALLGADSSDALKLMCVGSGGSLIPSIKWSNEFNIPPLNYSIIDGALPAGLSLDQATGEISGAPTEAGNFDITIKITNRNQDSRQGSLTLKVIDRFNTEMASALGMADFTFANYFDPAREYHNLTAGGEGFLRLGWVGNNSGTNFEDTWFPSGSESEWYKITHTYTPPHVEIKAPGTLTGSWTLIGRIKADNLPDMSYGHMAGIHVRKIDEGDVGAYGFILGFNMSKSQIAVYNVYDDNRIGITTGVESDLLFRIQKSGTTFSFAYRTPSGSWVSLGTQTANWAPGFVGACAVRTALQISKLSGSIDIDFLRIYTGALAIVTGSLPKSRSLDSFDYTLEASGGAGEYSWDISSGALPLGLSLDSSSGRISGILSSDGTTTFTVRATDGAGTSATKELSIIASAANEVLPDILSPALRNIEYSQHVKIYVGGLLEREAVIIGERCPVGIWEFTFLDTSAFEVIAPRLGKYSGNITENFEIANVIRIPASAWIAGMAKNDRMSFITGLSWENENPVKILYDILTRRVGLSPKQIDSSSYFGEIEIGDVRSHNLSTDKLRIGTTLPAFIKSDDVLSIGGSSIVVAVGNTPASCFPPEIEIEIDHVGSSLAGESVKIVQRSAPDPERSYDAEFLYCQAAGIQISITLDREMTIIGAIEAICAHAELLQHQHFGLEYLHAIRPRYQASIKALTDDDIKAELSIDSIGISNVINIKYAFNYLDQDYEKSYLFPPTAAENPSFRRYGQEIEKTIYCPGIYSDSLARYTAQRKYTLLSDGLMLLSINLDFRALLMQIGERWDISTTDPDISARFETIRKEIKPIDSRNVLLQGYNSRFLEKYALAGISEAGKCLAW